MKSYSSLPAIQKDLTEGKLQCKDLVEHYLNRIEENKNLNAFLEVFADEAREKAIETDKLLKDQHSPGSLFGLVIALKDNICYKDHHVSASSKILKGFSSLYSATVVERLTKEGAIIIGRTNCDEFAMGTSNENSAYGPVHNAASKEHVPGGSSGGSAVAVQAGMCHAALGSDTGGSIRQPASFCGIVGFKPTYGRISRHGLIAYASSFDQIGTLAKSVEDTALMLEVMAGEDDYDSTASTRDVPAYHNALGSSRQYKIGYIDEAIHLNGLEPEIKNDLDKKISALQSEGHRVEKISFPYLDYLVPTYYALTTAEASSNLARYDGVHYGTRAENAESMDAVYKRSRSEGFGKEVKRRIMLGTFVLSSGFYDMYYAKGQKMRRLISEWADTAFKGYDFILMPTTPSAAFKMGEKVKNPVSMYLADIYTVLANIAGLPAISLPLGKNGNGLPYGYQLLANQFEEEKLLSFSVQHLRHSR